MTSAGASNRAVLYARVSTKDQEREGFSIPAQLKLIREYARDQALTILREFTDVETAKQAGRGGFGEMLTFLQAIHPAGPSSSRRRTACTATSRTGPRWTISAR
jgi:predicted site-specific integrase-resolvase